MNNEIIPNQNIEMLGKDIKTISEIIIQSKDPEKNYYAAINLGINKIKHLLVVVESKEPVWNYKCIKHCVKTKLLTIEEKELLIAAHTQVILHSQDQNTINELNKFLKYNSINKKNSRELKKFNKTKKKNRN